MRILSIGGTRPQFVKMAVMVRAFQTFNAQHGDLVEHRLLHTGQHYDAMMSDIFFKELGLPTPNALLGIHPGSPGMQTAAMLTSIEAELINSPPDAVLIYGDTNSTLAAALAAAKLNIPLIHLEAGLRSFNRRMQEETNRIISDHISDLLLCPTQGAVDQLTREGLASRATLVGDVMLDAVMQFACLAGPSCSLQQLGLTSGSYALVTLHRAETTDNLKRLSNVLEALEHLRTPIVLPLHPRLKHLLGEEGIRMLARYTHIHLIHPVGYLEMLALEQQARLILTDSGGIQKEAYFLGVPCLTMRDETEWTETLHGGWNKLVGTEPRPIDSAVNHILQATDSGIFEERNLSTFGSGQAGARSVTQIMHLLETVPCVEYS